MHKCPAILRGHERAIAELGEEVGPFSLRLEYWYRGPADGDVADVVESGKRLPSRHARRESFLEPRHCQLAPFLHRKLRPASRL